MTLPSWLEWVPRPHLLFLILLAFAAIYIIFYLGCFFRILPVKVMRIWFMYHVVMMAIWLWPITFIVEWGGKFCCCCSTWSRSSVCCFLNGVFFRVLLRWIQPHITMNIQQDCGATWAQVLRQRPAVLLVNHTSFMDSIAITACSPLFFLGRVRTMVKRALLNIPFYGTVLRRCRHIRIHFAREEQECVQIDHAKQAMEKHTLEEPLQHGGYLLAFPEGRRGDSKKLESFRYGTFKALLKYRSPIFTLVGVGWARVWPVGTPLGGYPGTITMRLGRIMVDYDEPGLTPQLLADRCQKIMQQTLDELWAERNGAPMPSIQGSERQGSKETTPLLSETESGVREPE